MKKVLKITVFSILILCVSCGVLPLHRTVLPSVKDAYAEPWVASLGKRKGIEVKVRLLGDVEKINVSGLVYNKQLLKPTVRIENGMMLVYADFEKGLKTLFSKPKYIDKEDMILYSIEGKKYELKVMKIKHKPTKFYDVGKAK